LNQEKRNRGNGISEIGGKVARVATSDVDASEFQGSDSEEDIVGKAAQVAASDLGKERVSNTKEAGTALSCFPNYIRG
jgi:hypothetical protein